MISVFFLMSEPFFQIWEQEEVQGAKSGKNAIQHAKYIHNTFS